MESDIPLMSSVVKEAWGETPKRESVDLFTLVNDHGMTVKLSNYGGIVTEIRVPDRQGKTADVALGFDSLDGYIFNAGPFFGALVGRYGNRIAKGAFTLDGRAYKLATNNGPNHLHGGETGFDKAVWEADTTRLNDDVGVRLRLTSYDGEEGYPGELAVTVTYWLTQQNELKIDYMAKTDRPTPVNLTHHTYFNLAGEGSGTHYTHRMQINARFFTPVDAGLIPTGEVRPVAGTPFDFLKPTPIGDRIAADDEQIKFGAGYDHNFVLDKPQAGRMSLAARVVEPASGRAMEVWTEEVAVQFYAGNFLDGKMAGKGGKLYPRHGGFCLETQGFPDAPNHAHFPSTIVRPGKRYKTTTIYKFMAD